MPENERSGSRIIEGLAWIGAVGLITFPVLRRLSSRWHVRHPDAAKESAVDESLEETFPASDPPASRYVDIPVNRR